MTCLNVKVVGLEVDVVLDKESSNFMNRGLHHVLRVLRRQRGELPSLSSVWTWILECLVSLVLGMVLYLSSNSSVFPLLFCLSD